MTRTLPHTIAIDMTTERAPLNVDTLAQIIESERVELMQVHAMLRCLHDVLLYSDDDNASMHADVAKLTARLIDDCVGRLGEMVAHSLSKIRTR